MNCSDDMHQLQQLTNFVNSEPVGHSPDKFCEIIKFLFEMVNKYPGLEKYSDNEWNYSVPKMIDNAIIILENKSVK